MLALLWSFLVAMLCVTFYFSILDCTHVNKVDRLHAQNLICCRYFFLFFWLDLKARFDGISLSEIHGDLFSGLIELFKVAGVHVRIKQLNALLSLIRVCFRLYYCIITIVIIVFVAVMTVLASVVKHGKFRYVFLMVLWFFFENHIVVLGQNVIFDFFFVFATDWLRKFIRFINLTILALCINLVKYLLPGSIEFWGAFLVKHHFVKLFNALPGDHLRVYIVARIATYLSFFVTRVYLVHHVTGLFTVPLCFQTSLQKICFISHISFGNFQDLLIFVE